MRATQCFQFRTTVVIELHRIRCPDCGVKCEKVEQLPSKAPFRKRRKRIEAACLDLWEPFRLSIQEWTPQCQIVYHKFHVIQPANQAVDQLRPSAC